MSTPTDFHPSKRPNPPSPDPATFLSPPKRICKPVPSSAAIQTILHLPEDAVWSLRKSELRENFLALREYALNPYPLPSLHSTLLSPSTSLATPETSVNTTSTTSTSSTTTSPLLLLPLEIRLQIYAYTLPPPSPLSPLLGPHPRQLQSPLLLTQPITRCLLLLNRQIRTEALPILWGAATQTVHITIDYSIWRHKTSRSELVLRSEVTRAIRHVHVRVHLGSEKVRSRPGEVEREARVLEVRKGIKKVGKWLSGADIQSLEISWQEPPQTYTWEQKREILGGLKVLNAVKVDAGEINWGLGMNWNKGRKYRFEIEYLKELERGHRNDESVGSI